MEGNYSGPAQVSGSAGTGKTIVALHRAVFLARTNPEARVLLTTFSDTLANALRTRLRRLISNEPRIGERLEVHAMNTIGRRLYESHFGRPRIASRDGIQPLLQEAAREVHGQKFSLHFLITEWEEVVDAWQLDTWEAYRDVRRLGRKTRLPEPQRAVLWSIFDRVRSQLDSRGFVTYAGLFGRLAAQLADRKRMPFDFAVVDEAQDVSVAQLRFLAALGAGQPNRLFFAGDLGQRIFQQPFSWKALGVDIRDAPAPCTSITAPRIRSECRPTVCWVPNCLMSMVTPNNELVRFRYSTGRYPLFRFSKVPKTKAKWLGHGFRIAAARA